MKDNKNRRLRIFDIARDGKGLSKNQENKAGFKRFFRTFFDNFGKLVSANIFMVLGNFPAIFAIIAFAGYTKIESFLPMSDLFQNFDGILAAEGISPSTMALYSLKGLQSRILVPTPLTYVFYCLGALAIFTFGCVNVGTAYIFRNIAMGEPVFVWNDFWYAVKRNWKQALPFGVIDAIINIILIFNIYSMVSTPDFLASMLFWSNIILFVLYFTMRPYVYIQMVTFKLTVFKMFKNALIFSLLALKRNICALLGSLILIALEIAFLVGFGGVLISIAVAAPLAILFAALAYMKVYAAYFKIDEIMIAPYYDHSKETASNSEVIMTDDVTERERFEELKRKNGSF